MVLKLHKPVNEDFLLIVQEYNDLIQNHHEISDLINKENQNLSIYSDLLNDTSSINSKFDAYQKKHQNWINKAFSFHTNPNNLEIPKGHHQELSAFHFLNVLSNMISSADQMYYQVRMNHSNLISNIRYRKTMYIASISIFFALVGIAISLV